jgi:dTMP kinase
LRRLDEVRDRIEREDKIFHERVQAGYGELARTYPERFVILDGGISAAETHERVVETFEESLARARARPTVDIPAPGAPVPR